MKVLVLMLVWLVVSFLFCALIARANMTRRRLRGSREDQFANWRRRPVSWGVQP